MSADTILSWFHDNAYGELMREVSWLFGALEIVHFMALCVLFGTLLFVDLRLLGFNRIVPLGVALRFLPIALVAFALSFVSGIGFFCSAPLDYWPNPSFRLKMLLILLAGANALWFEVMERRRIEMLAADATPNLSARISAALSLSTWLIIIILGRLLPYTGTSQ